MLTSNADACTPHHAHCIWLQASAVHPRQHQTWVITLESTLACGPTFRIERFFTSVFLSCVSLMCTLRNCLASRQPLLLASLRNISSLSDHQIIFQICKGLGYGISDEARICPLCPHESPHVSHAEFACSIRIEAVRTMSRIFRYMTQS